MPSRHFTARDLWGIPRAGTPAPAPDGSFVVVPATTYDCTANVEVTRLWKVSCPTGESAPLTADTVSSEQPAVSPAGDRLAFVRKLEHAATDDERGPRFADQPQLYIMSLAGGEPERVTDLPLGLTGPQWFSDGRRLAFLAPLLPGALTLEGTAELAAERERDPVKAHITEDRVYRHWDRWLTDAPVHHVFVLDLDKGMLTDVTPSSRRWMPLMDPARHFDVAPDGAEIAFTATRSAPPHDPLLYGVFRVPLADGTGPEARIPEPELVYPDHAGPAYQPVYSPDGRWMIFGLQREIDFYADRIRLVACERASSTCMVLTEEWDRSADEWAFGSDPGRVFVAAEDRGRRLAWALDLNTALARPDSVAPSEITAGGSIGTLRPAAGRLFAVWSSLVKPPEVYSFAQDGSERQRVTTLTSDARAAIELGRAQEMTIRGAEGEPVQMFLVHPPGAAGAPETPAPLVHFVHGGPHGVFGDHWHWRWNPQVIAGAGYLVALVNFHGSTGWGQEFAASILGRWGDQPYTDLLAATDELLSRGLADPDRMAVAGGSYGGYLVTWAVSQTDRFACAINHAGVADFQAQFASDITQGRRRAMGGEPWDDLEGLDRYNPLRHCAGFRTPMLVLHGERDYRVPYTQGLQVYNVYKAMGLPARLVCFPDENHWILKPSNSLLWYREVLGWLQRWMPAADPQADDDSGGAQADDSAHRQADD